MNQESKFKIWLKGTAVKVKDSIGPIVALLIPGIIIGGSMTALRDSRRISKLENRFKRHVDVDNQNVDVINGFIDKTNGRIEELTRQNNELLERALRGTEGKAS